MEKKLFYSRHLDQGGWGGLGGLHVASVDLRGSQVALGIMDGLTGSQIALGVWGGLVESQVAMGGHGWPLGVAVDLGCLG
jgi:hypothetical protein